MGYIYNAMKKAKELIAASFKNKEAKYRDIFKIIDKRWDCQLHQPLHAAGYYLNTGLYYNNPEVEDATEVISGLQACIMKLILNEDEQIQINTELPLYRRADGIFGYPMAKKMRAKLAPAEWWMQYGASTPALKKFAIKVLSLTCSSSGCERNWSVFEHLHSKKRNRLEQSKLNDLVYIKYNRALRRRYDMRDTIDPIILDDGNLQDPNEWLKGALEGLEEDEENALVHEGEDLTYGDVATAVGARGPLHYTRRSANTSKKG
ncbi:putative HAT dimerization domain, ribonuclease H-like superfamily [Helianthus debilis subsp. tardiflorus]